MAQILIVDDDLDIADASRELLESVGHQISIGRNGEEGLAALSAAPLPDCDLLLAMLERVLVERRAPASA